MVVLENMHSFIWQQVLSNISISLPPPIFDTWFRPLKLNNQNDPYILYISAPNQVICDFVEQNYKKLIFSFLIKLSPKIKNIIFKPVEEIENIFPNNVLNQSSNQNNSSFKFSSSSFVFNKNFTFDSFVVGPGNEFAKSAAFAVAKAPGKTKFNPLLIYSGVGLGKTHLLHSIGNYINLNLNKLKVFFASSEEFYLHYIDAIKNNNTKLFSDSIKSTDVLLIDDIQFFSGKESTQEEFFYIFNTLYQNERQIILTSDVHPVSLKGLQDRLVSRFHWGLCVDIQPPNLETRVAIIKKKSEEAHLNIDANILSFIAENASSNVRELEGIILRLLAVSSITKQYITIELVKSIISDKSIKKNKKVSIEEIINIVSDYYKVPINNIREKNRRKEVAFCRQLAMYMVKNFTNYSLKSIGLHFGGRDHSTVIHAINNIEKLKLKDTTVFSDIETISSILNKI
jgi:chromosomal replication initiator protein